MGKSISYPNGKPASQQLETDVNREVLNQDFIVKVKGEQAWTVPKGYISDGGSIPEALEPIIGDPWQGVTRTAVWVHDYYCDTKERSQKATHKIFYELIKFEMARNNEYGWLWRWPWNNKVWQYSRAWLMYQAVVFHNKRKNPDWA